MPIRRKLIRRLTTGLLKKHNVTSPAVPVVDIAKAEGLRVVRRHTDDELSGFFLQRGDVVTIGVNAGQHINRRRFTIAHELGHYLLHGQEANSLRVDRTAQVQMYRNSLSSLGTNEEEKEANLFAADFLMPESFLRRDWEEIVPRDGDVEVVTDSLAKRYRVSSQAMLYRLSYLRLVENQAH